MADDQIVQSEESVEVATDVSGETPQVETTAPDKFAELKAELLAEVEKAKSHFQGVKDREVGTAKREAGNYRKRAEQLESIIEPLRQNPAFRATLAQAEQSAYARIGQQRERQEAEEQAKQEFFETLEDHVSELGIDRADTRIDWGRDAREIKEANKRFHKSLAKIQKEDSTSLEEKILKRIRSEQEDEKARQRREDGIDSVDTTVSGGAGIKKNLDALYASGDITWSEYNKQINK